MEIGNLQTLILGIESSCDETAAAVVADGSHVLSNVVASQLDVHARYGGVVPELASREHLRAITPVVRQALINAGVGYGQLSAIAVTSGPGLIGSLLVGVTYAKALCFARGLPLISVNHVEGHIHSVIMQHPEITFPAVALVVSGGHTHIFKMTSPGFYHLLGKTRDDAAGEAFDKVGKLLGLPFPGGPIIDRLAPYGNPRAVKFSFVRMKGGELDFSFSGIKTAVLRWTEAHPVQTEIEARKQLLKPTLQELLAHTGKATLDVLASFQYTVIEELLRRAVMAAELMDARNVIVAGGVACNAGLRKAAEGRSGLRFFFPTPNLATDNAAMIAAAAMQKFKLEDFAGFDLRPKANLTLA